MAGPTVPRREARSARVTVAVVLLAMASVAVAAAVVLREPVLLAGAGIVAVVLGWVALRLAWTTLVDGRYDHAADRTELARAYRDLFAERAVEQAGFVDSMATRLAQRDRVITNLTGDVAGLRGEVTRITMRAVEAESSAAAARTRLTGAHDQIAAMEVLITEHQQGAPAQAVLETAPAPVQAPAEPAAAARQRPPLLGRRGARRRADAAASPAVAPLPPLPEWAALEPDPVDSLMAWEQHAARVSRVAQEESGRRPGRHSAG